MSKEATFVFISFLLFASFLAHAGGRPVPVDPKETRLQDVEKEMAERGEECEGVGEDECLMRRTLVAHTDYIYTQEHH
ncbi:Phytosulfokine precursor protein (PSK) [Musa troglodytarum]|uniref:Phytosulfokine n=1 Tax=Musa troglodytarum TaxID=320322 RepID=A0A9E7LFA9_9LILI|nr:Phytosulfokine precursor protein (PSK) [Musa troglodytarum]